MGALKAPNLARSDAIHMSLLEAQRSLIDHVIFHQLKESLLQNETADSRHQWHIVRVSSSEVLILLPVGVDAQLVQLVIRHGPFDTVGKASKDGTSDVYSLWSWLADATALRLRELCLEMQEASSPVATNAEGIPTNATNNG